MGSFLFIKRLKVLYNKSKKHQEENSSPLYDNTYKAGEQRWKVMKYKFKR